MAAQAESVSLTKTTLLLSEAEEAALLLRSVEDEDCASPKWWPPVSNAISTSTQLGTGLANGHQHNFSFLLFIFTTDVRSGDS